ncbi:hypothetical protein MHYP_G00326670 [Metynnis hypsauchen]
MKPAMFWGYAIYPGSLVVLIQVQGYVRCWPPGFCRQTLNITVTFARQQAKEDDRRSFFPPIIRELDSHFGKLLWDNA